MGKRGIPNDFATFAVRQLRLVLRLTKPQMLDPVSSEWFDGVQLSEDRVGSYSLPEGCRLEGFNRVFVTVFCSCGWCSGTHGLPSQAVAHLMLHRANLTTVPCPMPPRGV